ncbi:MAG: prolyl oligopeptidase family serine peptidase [Solirubrobacteraceae bacterium]|nr:prolyl oligopeptidase family serine peptidase [Solirubrobacteraceae bacterium]
MLRRLLAVAVLMVAACVAAPASAFADGVATPRWVWIKSKDGAPIHSLVVVPKHTAPGVKRPAVAFAAAWNGGAEQNTVPAYRLAQRGYVVVSYTTRGTGKDGKGKINMGGPKDVEDMQAVIDWMLANQPVDEQRIGAAGISYGAGIALITAAVDKRIRSVASMSGWTDLGRALYPHETRNSWAGFILWASARTASHVDGDFLRVFKNFFSNRDTEDTLAFARGRSPVTYIDQLNANRPAVMLSQNWNELAFPPDQIIDYFQQITGPKLMLLRPGDHVGQETLGEVGFYNPVFNRLYRWFDDTLATPEKREAAGSRIEIQPRAPEGERQLETYTDWSQVSTGTRRWYLGGVANRRGDSAMGDAPATGWSTTLKPGYNAVNYAGGPIISHWTEVWWGRPMWGDPNVVDRKSTAMWFSPPVTDWVRLRGEPRIHLTITPTHRVGTIVPVLWSVGADGKARHITHAPYTWRNATPGKPFTLDLPLRPNAFNVPPGHRILLATSTWEANYFFEKNPMGSRITFGSPEGDPAWIELPTR